MLCQGQRRPTKQVSSCIATLTPLQKVQLKRIGKILHRKQLKLRRQRILELAETNFCSKVTKYNLSSIRDLKNFARQLGKRTIRHMHCLWQQKASGVLEDYKSSSQCKDDYVYWNNIESRDMTPRTIIFDNILGSKDDESPIDVLLDQWVGVDVHLFGKKSSISEVGSTTSNVCDKLRSIVADLESEDIYPSLIKKRDKQEDKDLSFVRNDGIVPSWVSCRRTITRTNASSGISNDHIVTLLASLPKTGSHIDDYTMTPISISSTKETDQHICANEERVDQSSLAIIPKEQSFASPASIINSYKDLSLDFDLEKQANISILHRDAIQVCPTTPEKAQKRRRSYQGIIPNHNDNTNVCEPFKLPSGDATNFKKLGGQVHFTNSLSLHSMEIQSNCNSTRIGKQNLNAVAIDSTRSFVDSMPIQAIAHPLGSISHTAFVILDHVQESSQLLKSHEPSALVVVMDDGDKGSKESGQVLLTDSLSPYSTDFESRCNSTKNDKQGFKVVAIECAKSLVESTPPPPPIVDPCNSVSHMATLPIDLIQDSPQVFQTQVATAPILVVESNKRKGRHAKSKLNEAFGGIAKTSKVRKKYKPRVAKVKQNDRCSASQLQNETNENTKDHRMSKHARTEEASRDIIKRGRHKKKKNCTSQNPLKINPGTIEESRKSFYQEDNLTLQLHKLASKPTALIPLDETPSSIDNTCITRNVEGYMPNSHPPSSFDSGHDRIESDSLLCTTCGLKQRIVIEGSDTGLINQTDNLSTPSEDQMISDSFIERQKQIEALSVELSNRVIALLDLPAAGQSHSITGEVEQSTSDVLQCYDEEIAMKEYPQATDEYGISSLSDEWTIYHVGSAEMTALDAFNEEEMRFDMLFKDQQSIVQGDMLSQNLNAKFNEYFSSTPQDTWVRGSLIAEADHCGVSSNLLCGIDELGDGSLVRPNPCPSSMHKSSMARTISPEPLEERSMSSFYASTSTEVNDIMLSRLNKMIEENCRKDIVETENAEQDLNMDVIPHCGQTNAPNLCLVQISTERSKGTGLLGDYCLEEEDLMKVRNSIIYQMRSQFQNPDPGSTLSTEIDDVPAEQNPEDLINMRDAVLCQMRSQFQDPDPDSTFSTESDVVLVEDNHEGEDLMKLSDTVLLQMHSQSLNPDPNSSFFTESTNALEQDTPEKIQNSTICQLSFESQDADPNSDFVRENTTVLAKANDNLEDKSHDILIVGDATLNPTSPQKNTCLEKRPFHLMTFIQLVEYMRTILINTSETCPLELSSLIQSHQSEEERVEFEKLWPMMLQSISSEQLQELMDLAEIDFSSIMGLMQCQQVKGQDEDEYQLPSCVEVIQCQEEKEQDDGAKEDNHLTPCMEVVQNQQIERLDDRAKEGNPLIGLDPSTKENGNHLADVDPSVKEGNHLTYVDPSTKEGNYVTDIVPFVGNSIVAYDGSFFRKRKPRPKVNLDTETIRVWKLLMGKTESTENDPDLDNEMKWKQERLVMQEQANTFIRRMHLIQGDRSFSRWKGSVVDSVIGVFLTQNVSDVLSSSAYMCLRARFPLGRGRGRGGSVQSKFPEGDTKEILQGDHQINLESFKTYEEAQTSCFHYVLSSTCAPGSLANEDREEILLHSQDCCNEESNNTSNLETRHVNTLLFPWSENPSSLTLQKNENVFNIQSEQPPTTDTSMIYVSTEPLGLNVNANENAGAFDLREITQENIFFLQSGNDNQEPLASSTGQGENSIELKAHCITQPESCSLTKEVVVSNIESQLALSASVHLRKEELTGLERAKLEAEQVRARKSCKWNALAEKYNAQCQQAALDAATTSPRTEMTEDGVDWEAVRCADLEEIADAIKERGMNWKLAGRIKGFLERLRQEQGSINLEWLRSIASDDAKEFLSSVHGLGLKSVECIRLLSLHHLAFPVDTNVGRICVRLGWVPLEPLPEELQLHVLELYPVQATIQKYLWPRLCTLDQQTLYELHYQLITFGKVFCTKSKPNCNACPMRSDCKHFASALASAKLALLPPEEDSSGNSAPLALPPGSSVSADGGEAFLSTKPAQPSMNISQYCQPIIEEPMTPESEADMSEFDIEDFPFFVEEIPHETMMKLIIQGIHGRRQEMQQLDRYSNRCCNFNLSDTAFSEPDFVQEMDMMVALETPAVAQPMVESSMLDSAPMVVDCEDTGKDFVTRRASTLFDNHASSKEVVMLPPGVASIPVPKLKNIERLRTVHYVYELPDNHPLLEGMDVREADDPCFYLLAIWSPGEVPESIPNINDDNEETGFNLSNDEESIKATLLVPCRTAMKGNFPLNGTYFQVNEVFADHESSLQPILVPRILLWNLRRRFVYFGTSVTSILRGMTTEEIQACFWLGYVCVRGFDRMTRAPKPLVRRLHFQTTKSIMKSASVKNTKT